MRTATFGSTAVFLSAALGFVLLPQAAFAQGARNSLNSSRNGNLRQNYQTGAMGGQSRLSGVGGAAGMGQLGGGAAGRTSTGLGGQGPLSAGLSQTTGERFQQSGFVGRDATDVRNSFSSLTGRGGQGLNTNTVVENLNQMRESQRRWRQQSAPAPAFRVKLQPAFAVPSLAVLQPSLEVQDRIARAMLAGGIVDPDVQLVGGVAYLRGVVATERDRALAERLASLEPGVFRVENLLTIQALPAPLP